MKLKDLLFEKMPVSIEYRCNEPKVFGGDMLFGHCYWNGEQLISGDGDCYYLDDEIEKFELRESGQMIVWIEVEWSGDNE